MIVTARILDHQREICCSTCNKELLQLSTKKGEIVRAIYGKFTEDRLTPNKPAFTYVGADYFGLLEVKLKRSRCKRYGLLFTCLTSRATHIELAYSLDTDSMLNALRRFICIRGCPELLRSDHGTNFVCGNKE